MFSRSKECHHVRQQLIPECLAITFRRRKPPDPTLLRLPKGEPTAPGPGPSTTRPDSADDGASDQPPEEGNVVFQDFVRENQQCFWNPCLVQSVSSLELLGYVIPDIILVSGSAYALEMVRSAWARRVLRPPRGYDIHCLGDVRPVELCAVAQTQFAPLAEALCKTVLELSTVQRTPATMDVIAASLETDFPEMVVPKADILYRSLGSLIKDRKLYHTGKGYCVVTPDTFRSACTALQPQTERQMLMTNEEAIVRLHRRKSRCRSVQTDQMDITDAWKTDASDKVLYASARSVATLGGGGGRILERSHSLRLLSKNKEKDKLNRSNSFKLATRAFFSGAETSKSDSEHHESGKREKRSMFSRLFRRSQSRDDPKPVVSRKGSKLSSFSAQFPPVEWSDSDTIHLHSQGTQTLNFQVPPLTKLRSSSVGRPSNQDRHSIHMHSSTSSLKGDCPHHRCDSDPYLRSKSSSLPRRSFSVVDAANGVEGPRRCSTPSSSRRSSRASCSPRRTNDRRHSKVLTELDVDNLNSQGRDSLDRIAANRLSYHEKSKYNNGKTNNSPSKQIRNVEDASTLKEQPRKLGAWTAPDYNIPNGLNRKYPPDSPKYSLISEQINNYNSEKEPASCNLSENDSPKKSILKREILVNESLDLEVNLKSIKSPAKSATVLNSNESKSTPSGNHSISVKTGLRNNRPVSITTVTSITTSLSQGAIKDLAKSSSFADVPNKSRSNESSPTYGTRQKENLAFTPIKPKLSSKKSELYSTGADDSGFTSISPDISSHEIP